MAHCVPFLCTLVAASGGAQAAFVGGSLHENVAASAASSATVNGPSRVYELFIVFDEADDILNSIGNANFASNDGSSLIQTGVFGSVQDVDGDLNPGAWGFVPESQWDTYVAIGGPFPGASATTTDPDFAFTANGVTGGWFDIPGDGGARQGVAGNGVDLGGGLWGVFAGQFVLEGEGIGSGSFEGHAGGLIFSLVFEGFIDVNWIDAPGGSNNASGPIRVGFPPAPGTAGLFGVAGVAAARRRR